MTILVKFRDQSTIKSEIAAPPQPLVRPFPWIMLAVILGALAIMLFKSAPDVFVLLHGLARSVPI